MKITLFLFAAGVSLAATAASAATMQQSFSFGGSGVEFSESYTFAQFNEAGTLTNVDLSVGLSAEGEISVNLCALIGDCDPAEYELGYTTSGAFGAGGAGTSDAVAIDFTIDGTQSAPYNAAFVGGVGYGGDVSAFVGVGDAGTVVASGNYFGFFGGASSGSYEGEFVLTYTYDPSEVPLPASLPLALGGTLLLGGLARRKRN